MGVKHGRRRYDPTATELERRARAIEMRKLKIPYETIAREFGVSVTTAWRITQRAYRDYMRQVGIEEVIAEELAGLDDLERALILRARNNPPMVDGQAGPRPYSTSEQDAAVDRVLKVRKRRAEILGTDAPKKLDVRFVTIDALDAEIERLERELTAEGDSDGGDPADDEAPERAPGDRHPPEPLALPRAGAAAPGAGDAGPAGSPGPPVG